MERMLGREPIVRDERLRSCSRGDVPLEMTGRLGGPQVEPSPVQIEDRLVRSKLRRTNPEPRDPANGIGFERHVVARQHSLHDGIEGLACPDPAQLPFQGAHHRSEGAHGRCIIGIEGMCHYVVHWGSFLTSRGSKLLAVSPKTFLRSEALNASVRASSRRPAIARSRRKYGKSEP